MTNMKSTKRALVSSALALFLCFAMLIGTTYAWFTDSVTSDGNIIQTGNLKIGFQWAEGKEDPETATWNTVDGPLFKYENWEPGYAVAKHLKITNEGSLALNYRMRIVADGVVSKLADVIDVYVVAGDDVAAMDRKILNGLEPVGTLTQVLLASGANNAKNDADKGVDISKIVKGSLKAGAEADIYTLVLKMQETAGNDYQNMDLGCTFSVQLLATQMSAEEDSFDNQYDAVVPNEEIPAALVRPLEDRDVIYTINGWDNDTEVEKTLDVAFTFQPTEDEIDLSFYQHWMADYVVSADKDVPANSMALAGYYSIMCDNFNNGNWVALMSDQDIAAGTEIPLVESMGWPVHYSDIVNFGTDGIGFRCGAIDLTGENMGTTLTVELRIYETTAAWDDSSASSVKTGKYITIGKFTYTFGVNTPEKLEYALTKGGEYKLTGDIALDKALNVPAGVTATLDLNGKTITGTDKNVTGNFGLITNKGNLTIKDSVGGGAITLKAETDRDWSAYSSVISNTVGGKFILESGTLQHLGGSDMAYGIDNLTNGKGTYAEVVINGGTVKSTYRAVRMFLNGVEAENILTVNGGVIEGTNKSIWMQDPSKNANTGKLTVTEGATLNGDVYLSVTAGSTEWPVEVSIAASAVKGEVLSSNVPAGYEVQLADGVYSVK